MRMRFEVVVGLFVVLNTSTEIAEAKPFYLPDASKSSVQDDETRPAFFRTYFDLIDELIDLHNSQTTFRFRVDGQELADTYNDRLSSDMSKSFEIVVVDLDMVRENQAKIEFERIVGVADDIRIRCDQQMHSLIVEMTEDDAYQVNPGSRVRITGTPRILFRPSSNTLVSRAFVSSVLAGWEVEGQRCFLVIDDAFATPVEQSR